MDKKFSYADVFPRSRPGICHAIIMLNKHGKPARAREEIVGHALCRGRRQVWSLADDSYICADCLTPARATEEESNA